MKKFLLSVLFSVLCIGFAYSQFDPQLTQYMLNPSAFNPAAVGEGEMIQIAGLHRIQWIGMPNGGQTTIFSINSPVKIGGKSHGLGFKFFNDKIGGFVNQTAHLEYAFKKKLVEGTLSFGADIGFVSLTFNGDSVQAHKVTLGDYHLNIASDPAIPQTQIAATSFDLNVGAFYSTPKFYAGISYSHLNSPVINWNDQSDIRMIGSLFVTGGYNYTLPDTKYVIKPSGLFKTNFSTMQIDVSTRMEYDNKYWGGIGYRLEDAVSVLAGINAPGGLAIGVSYDVTTSKISTVSWGSFEVMMVYSFEYVFQKRNSKYKSIRIL